MFVGYFELFYMPALRDLFLFNFWASLSGELTLFYHSSSFCFLLLSASSYFTYSLTASNRFVSFIETAKALAFCRDDVGLFGSCLENLTFFYAAAFIRFLEPTTLNNPLKCLPSSISANAWSASYSAVDRYRLNFGSLFLPDCISICL